MYQNNANGGGTTVVPMSGDIPGVVGARDEGLYDEQGLTSSTMRPGAGLEFFGQGRSGRSSAETNSAVANRLSGTQFASVRGFRLYFQFSALTAVDVALLAADMEAIQRGVFVYNMDDNPVVRVPFLKVGGPLVYSQQIDAAGAVMTVQPGPGYYIEDPDLYVPIPGSRNFNVKLEFPQGLGATPIGNRTRIMKLELLGARANQTGRGY